MKTKKVSDHKFVLNKDSNSPHPVCLVCDEDGFAEGHASERLNILTPQPDWEKRLEKIMEDTNEIEYGLDDRDWGRVKDLISQEIQRAKMEVLDEVWMEGKRVDLEEFFKGKISDSQLDELMGFNQAVQELQDKITKIKKEMK